MTKKDFYFIFLLFIFWRIFLFLIQYFAFKFVPLQHDFLGGGLNNYLANPYFWSLANFDGEHYLALAAEGYKPLTYYFFPLYPLLIKLLSLVLPSALKNYAISGIFISHITLFLALLGFWKLVKLDYSDFIARLSLILVLIFPTSFYFGAVYTESLFLCLSVWSIYFARRKKWFYSAILAGLSSATRLVGVILAPIILLEFYLVNRKISKNWFKLIPVFLLSLSGFLMYMYYLWQKTGDPLIFYHTVGIFGAQRSSNLIFLPQVFYRYIFKIIPSLNFQYFPNVFTTFLEIFTATIFLIASIWSFFKLRVSYAVFLFFGYLIPTLSGSFSSLPRYVLVLFPFFIGVSIFFSNKKSALFAFSLILFILLIISFSLFVRGYWLA